MGMTWAEEELRREHEKYGRVPVGKRVEVRPIDDSYLLVNGLIALQKQCGVTVNEAREIFNLERR